jgi:hypothetical protein
MAKASGAVSTVSEDVAVGAVVETSDVVEGPILVGGLGGEGVGHVGVREELMLISIMV